MSKKKSTASGSPDYLQTVDLPEPQGWLGLAILAGKVWMKFIGLLGEWGRRPAILLAGLFLLVGLGFAMRFSTPSPDKSPTSVESPSTQIEDQAEDQSEDQTPASFALSPVEQLSSLPPPGPSITRQTLNVKRGQTLDVLLQQANVTAQDRVAAIKALTPVFNPKRLKPGQELTVALSEDASLYSLRIEVDTASEAWVHRTDDGIFSAQTIDLPREIVEKYAKGEITTSLYVDAVKAGVPPSIIQQSIRIFSFDVDFQRDIRRNDRFEFFYRAGLDQAGNMIDRGPIMIASLTLSGKTLTYYRFDPENPSASDQAGGFAEYFNAIGKTARKGLLRTPVDGARLSSGYGQRKHPILGYTKMHKGVDFAAPTGTPIYAAGNGIVDFAGRKGSYGKYIRIRHGNGYATAYAHLHRISVRTGARVVQYQTIGQVGSTGRSTGPHLHYEILYNGKQVNPVKVKMPTGRILKDQNLVNFENYRERLQQRMAAAVDESQTAGPIQMDEIKVDEVKIDEPKSISDDNAVMLEGLPPKPPSRVSR